MSDPTASPWGLNPLFFTPPPWMRGAGGALCRGLLPRPPWLGLGQLRAAARPRPVLVGLHGPAGPVGIPLQTWGGCQEQPWADSAGRHAEPAPSLCVPVNPRLPPPSLSAYPDELGPKHWSDKRYENLMRLKQEALSYAREQRAHYILVGQEEHGGHPAYRAQEESWPAGRPRASSPCVVPRSTWTRTAS